MEKIKVSILMPVYNSEKFLKDSINSILNQTYKNLEFIIVNDGSTDMSLKIINTYKDKRIKIINNIKNRGIVYSLNLGLKYCKGKYIIRMDSDDIAYKNRIEEQVKYMEENTDIVAAGTYVRIFGDGIKERLKKNPILYKELKVKSLFTCPIYHPTVILKKDIIKEIGYSDKYDGYEDFDLWQNLIKKGYKISNIPKELLKYRVVKTSISRTFQKRIIEEYVRIKEVYRKSLIYFLGKDNIGDEIVEQFTILNLTNLIPLKIKADTDISEYLKLIKYLIEENRKIKYCSEKYLKKYLYMRWSVLVLKSKQFQIKYILNKEFINGLIKLIDEKYF